MVTLYVDDDKQRVAVMSEGDGSMLPVCMMMIAASPGRSPTIAREYAKLFAAAPELLEALCGLTARYASLIESGDCGNWNPEEEREVIAARAAIAKASTEGCSKQRRIYDE